MATEIFCPRALWCFFMQLCPSTGQPCDCGAMDSGLAVTKRDDQDTKKKHSELIFPPELQKWKPAPLQLKGETSC